jgi:hypothetical protein
MKPRKKHKKRKATDGPNSILEVVAFTIGMLVFFGAIIYHTS